MQQKKILKKPLYEHPKIGVHDVEGCVPFCDLSDEEDVEDEETPSGDGSEEPVEGSLGRRLNWGALW